MFRHPLSSMKFIQRVGEQKCTLGLEEYLPKAGCPTGIHKDHFIYCGLIDKQLQHCLKLLFNLTSF